MKYILPENPKDDSGFLLASDLPSVDSNALAVMTGKPADTSDANVVQPLDQFSSSASFKPLWL